MPTGSRRRTRAGRCTVGGGGYYRDQCPVGAILMVLGTVEFRDITGWRTRSRCVLPPFVLLRFEICADAFGFETAQEKEMTKNKVKVFVPKPKHLLTEVEKAARRAAEDDLGRRPSWAPPCRAIGSPFCNKLLSITSSRLGPLIRDWVRKECNVDSLSPRVLRCQTCRPLTENANPSFSKNIVDLSSAFNELHGRVSGIASRAGLLDFRDVRK